VHRRHADARVEELPFSLGRGIIGSGGIGNATGDQEKVEKQGLAWAWLLSMHACDL